MIVASSNGKIRYLKNFPGIFILLLVKFLQLPTPVAGQHGELFTITRYTSTNGLPQNTVRSLAMDNDRFLWMTTEEGLVRFDGRNFKIFNQNNYPGINNDRFRYIIPTLDNKLVVSELSGASFLLENGIPEQIRKGDLEHPIHYFVKGIVPDISFYLNGLYKKFDFIADSELPSETLYCVELPGKTFGVILNKNSLLRIFHQNRIVKEIRIPGEPPRGVFTINGALYYFDTQFKLFFINTRTEKVFPVKLTGSLSSQDLKLLKFYQNLIWNPVYKDVYFRKGTELHCLKSNGNPLLIKSELVTAQLPGNCIILDVLFDEKSHNYFIGTDTKGLYIFKKNNIRTVVLEGVSGNQSNAFYSQCSIDSNTIFSGFGKEFNIEGGRNSRFPVNNTSPECLIMDEENRLYYPEHYDLKYYDIDDKISGVIATPYIRDYFCFESDGDSILVANNMGIGYIKNLEYHHVYNHIDPAPNERIEHIIRGPDGKIWIALCKGVMTFDDKSGKIVSLDGLQNICARAFFKDDDKVFVGTYGNGYYIWKSGKAVKMPTDKNHYLSHVHSFYIDGKNYLWMSTNNGLFRTNYNDILSYLENPAFKISYEYFGNNDGILNTEFNGGCTPHYVRLKNGYLSYPSMEGLVWLNPEKVPVANPDEKILIDELIIDNQNYSLDSARIVPSGHEMIEIHFATPYWGNIENLEMEYKLDGLNSNWTTLDPEEGRLQFSNLSSGSYRLLIRKVHQSGQQPFIESELTFSVEKKFYETTGFILFVVVLGGCLIYLLMILNSRRIIRQNIELEKKIADRTDELKVVNVQLQENYRQLAQQENFLRESIEVKNQLISIISHDIITPLKFISMVSRISKRNPDLLNRNKLIDSMKDIEFASDKLYNNASNILNWMKFQNNRIVPKMDHIALHDFVNEITEPLQGMAETKEIIILNQVPEEDIIVSDRFILMIVLQNIISNAIKYSNHGTITILANESAKYYNITITDNGIGMSAEIKDTINNIIYRKVQLTSVQADNKETGNQLGYFIITDFLHLLSGTLDVESTLGKGTSVTIGIPH